MRTLYDNLYAESAPMIGENYTLSEFGDRCIGDYLDEATTQALYNHYLFRRPCTTETMTLKSGDNVNLFELMFQNRLQIYANRYLQYLRIENIDFDPMVTQYLERWVQGGSNSNETTTGNIQGTSGSTTESTEHTVTDDSTHTTVTGREHATDDRTYENRTNLDENTTTSTRSVHAELPQTTGNYGSGMPSSLNWSYLTNQDESAQTVGHTADTDVNGTDNNVHDGNSTTTTDTTYDGDTQVTGNVIVSGNTGQNSTGTRSVTGATDTKERYTGRSGVRAPAELLDLARRYITRTNAFRWLCTQLDPLFYTLYERGYTYAEQSEIEPTGL